MVNSKGELDFKNYIKNTNTYNLTAMADKCVKGISIAAKKELSKKIEYKPLLRGDDEEELDPSLLQPTVLKIEQYKLLIGHDNHGFIGAEQIDKDASQPIGYKEKISEVSNGKGGIGKRFTNFLKQIKPNSQKYRTF